MLMQTWIQKTQGVSENFQKCLQTFSKSFFVEVVLSYNPVIVKK